MLLELGDEDLLQKAADIVVLILSEGIHFIVIISFFV